MLLSMSTAGARQRCSHVLLEYSGCCAEYWKDRENRRTLPMCTQIGRTEKVPENLTVFPTGYSLQNALNVGVLFQFPCCFTAFISLL
jgi:hypothetical protein